MSTTRTTLTWKSKIAAIWSNRQNVAEWRLPFALFALGLLAYAAAYAWRMLANFDLVNIIRDVNYDDSFYYFQIAYNLAQGKFSTFDGGITQTNGYHPIWLLSVTPFYWLFDKETALFGIKALEIMLVAGGVVLIAAAAWLSRLAWPLLFAALPILYRNPEELLYGMEAATAMFTLALLILAVCLYMRNPERWKWRLAAVAFALPWVRIEYIAVSLAATAALCAIEWSRQERRSLRLSELANIRLAYIPLISAIAGMLVYFAYNGLVFGGILPVSAVTRQWWAQNQWAEDGGYNLIESLRGALQYDAFDYELLFALEICAYLLLVWRLALRSNDRRDWLLTAFLVGVFGLAAGHIAKFAQTVLIMHPIHGDKIWYFVPAYLMTALIIPVRLYVAICLIRRFLAPRRRVAANALSVGVVVIGAAFLLARADFAEPFRWVDQKSADLHREEEISAYIGAQVINRALPEGSVIGSWDAGVIGYFSRFPVVNMDGFVNSYDHFHARHIHIEPLEARAFSRRYGVTHFANTDALEGFPIWGVNIVLETAPFDRPYGKFQFRVWTDAPPDTSGEINYSQYAWDNMQPRFDYFSDGIGAFLDGRILHIFAKDCLQDTLLTWTLSDQKHKTTLMRVDANPYRSRANACVATRLLPHNHAQPAQAKLTPLKTYFANLTRFNEPIIRSRFDVYSIDGSLIYAKSQCGQADVEPRFFASVFPVDANDLLDNYNQRGYDLIDFKFDDHGAIAADGRCWAAVDLPGYPVANIHTGQYSVTADGYNYLWEVTSNTGVSASLAGEEVYLGKQTAREPIIRSRFDVYLIDGRLIYTKPQCGQADVKARFYISISPVDANDLPDNHMQRGYDAIEFNFSDYGATANDGRCWAAVDLPNYPFAELRTGQYAETPDGYNYLWESAYRFE